MFAPSTRSRILILGGLFYGGLTTPLTEDDPSAPPRCSTGQSVIQLSRRQAGAGRTSAARARGVGRRVAFLIPGLQDRLLVRSKAEHVVRHLAREGARVDVFVDVVASGQEHGPMWVGGPAVVASLEAADAGAIEGPFRDAGAHLVDVKIRSGVEDIHMPAQKPEGWDRFHLFKPFDFTSPMGEVGRNIIRMFKALERLMVKAGSVAQQELQPYDYVLFDHDDSEWLGPLQLQKIAASEASRAGQPPTVYTRGCKSWGGLNDKTFLFTWPAAQAVLWRLFADIYVPDDRLNVANTEKFWAAYVSVKNVTSVAVSPGMLPTISSTYRKEDGRIELCQKNMYVCPTFLKERFRINTCGDLSRPQSLLGSIHERLPLVSISETARIYKRWCLQFVPSVVAIVLGAFMYGVPGLRGPAPFVLFFGGQSFMNLYIKAVLSGCAVDAITGLRGIPAPFAITGTQQCVGLFFLSACVCLSQLTPWPYRPKPLSSRRECFTILLMSLVFCLNIGLNNLSLSMLDLSLNITLRSSTPVLVALVQLLVAAVTRDLLPKIGGKELALYVLGCACMACTLWAKAADSGGTADPSLVPLGAAICVFSVLSSAGELVLVSCLGLHLGLNPVDVLLYTAIPSTLLLAVPAVFLPHPAWPGHRAMTDLQVVEKVLRLNPDAIGLVLLSGLFALLCNVLLYRIVQQFSAPQAAFAATANKAVTIAISMLMGLEFLPRSHALAVVVIVGIMGTLGSSLQLGLMKAVK